MEKISRSIKKKDHDDKISGRALYVDDCVMEGMLYGKQKHALLMLLYLNYLRDIML